MRQTADAENHLKILYVEDNDDNIYTLEKRLSRAGISFGKD
jgi:CheY-like chemotaxis protein